MSMILHWPLGISTAGFEPASVLEHVALFDKYDVRWMEIFNRGPESACHFDYQTPDHARRLAEALSLYKISASSLHAPFVDIGLKDMDARHKAIQEILTALDRAVEIRAGILVMHVDAEQMVSRKSLFQSLIEILSRADDVGVKVAFENGGEPNTGVDAMVALVQKLDRPTAGICLDTSHVCILEGPSNVAEAVQKCGKFLIALHVSDGDGNGDRHWLPGDPRGKIDWPSFVAALDRVRYTGCFMCEPVEGQSTWEGIEGFIRRTVESVRQLIT